MNLTNIIRYLVIYILALTSANCSALDSVRVYLDEELPNIYGLNKNQRSEVVKLTRPPIVGFNKDIGWVCNICKEIPSKENGNLTKRRYKRMKTTWEIKDDLSGLMELP